jgi:hypothetical protein
MDFMDRQRYRQDARNAAFSEAALLLESAAARILNGRPSAVDRHTADVLRSKADEILALRTESPVKGVEPQ